MHGRAAFAAIALSILVSEGARAQCINAPPGPPPRVSRAEQAARRRAWSVTDRLPQDRQALARLGPPTRSDTHPVLYSEEFPDSTFLNHEFRFGEDFYGIMQNRAGREWLDAVVLNAAEPWWPAALQIGTASSESARALGQPQVMSMARDTTVRCYSVRAKRGGALYLYHVNDTLRRVTWSLDLP